MVDIIKKKCIERNFFVLTDLENVIYEKKLFPFISGEIFV